MAEEGELRFVEKPLLGRTLIDAVHGALARPHRCTVSEIEPKNPFGDRRCQRHLFTRIGRADRIDPVPNSVLFDGEGLHKWFLRLPLYSPVAAALRPQRTSDRGNYTQADTGRGIERATRCGGGGKNRKGQ